MAVQADVIRKRWCKQLTETPIKSMIFPDRLVSRKRRKPLTPIPGFPLLGKHSDGLQTVVYRRMRFDAEDKLLSYLFDYDGSVITRPKQGNEERPVTGLFVRPPVKQQTDSQLQEMHTLKQQVSAIWPNQFSDQVYDMYLLHMVLAEDINGNDVACVRMQDPGPNGQRGIFSNLEQYLAETRDSHGLEKLRIERGINAHDLRTYETIVKNPALDSGTFMQIYVSVPGTHEYDAIPLAEFIENDKVGRTRELIDDITDEIMRQL
jgi:hypothetical protein